MNLKTKHLEGHVIFHPGGFVELSYFFNKEWKTKTDGYKEDVGLDNWMKIYRPQCKVVRMKLVDI